MDENDNMHHYAEVSDGSYGSKDLSHLGYRIDTELSNRNRTLYHNPETGKAVLSFRGTNIKNKGDLGTDALLALGLKEISSRFKNANKAAKKTIEKYGKENVAFVGHSLGGSQALYVNSKHGVETHAYNPFVEPKTSKAHLLTKAMFSLFKKPVQNNAIIYKTRTDPISIFANLSNAVVKTVKSSHKDGHSLKNFLKR